MLFQLELSAIMRLPPRMSESAPVLGRYPTAVQHLASRSPASAELWVKRDDLTNEIYGGNKVRKLEHILPAALRVGARRLLTLGTVGSHHVLATTLHGRRAGLYVAALLTPQPRTERAEQVVRTAIGHGLEAYPVPRLWTLPFDLLRIRRAADYFVMPGGTSVGSSLGYFSAAREMLDQVKAGLLPMPDLVVVPLGSGGTVAGLLAGLVAGGYKGTLLAVRIVPAWMAGVLPTLALARAVLRRAHPTVARTTLHAAESELAPRLRVAGAYLGRGYGFPTPDGDRATKLAAEHGLVLEPTYTAKAFAAALDQVTAGGFKRVLFWHTFSSAPLQPLLAGAPSTSELPMPLRALLVGTVPNS